MPDEGTPENAEAGEERDYQVVFTGTATMYVTVTAVSPTDAVEAAEDHLNGQLCVHCSNPVGYGGNVEREWPEYMEVDEVTVDGTACDPDDY